ncbi:hypothetical protein RUM44_006077, partial [Polyplax serrata]
MTGSFSRAVQTRDKRQFEEVGVVYWQRMREMISRTKMDENSLLGGKLTTLIHSLKCFLEFEHEGTLIQQNLVVCVTEKSSTGVREIKRVKTRLIEKGNESGGKKKARDKEKVTEGTEN